MLPSTYGTFDPRDYFSLVVSSFNIGPVDYWVFFVIFFPVFLKKIKIYHDSNVLYNMPFSIYLIEFSEIHFFFLRITP